MEPQNLPRLLRPIGTSRSGLKESIEVNSIQSWKVHPNWCSFWVSIAARLLIDSSRKWLYVAVKLSDQLFSPYSFHIQSLSSPYGNLCISFKYLPTDQYHIAIQAIRSTEVQLEIHAIDDLAQAVQMVFRVILRVPPIKHGLLEYPPLTSMILTFKHIQTIPYFQVDL